MLNSHLGASILLTITITGRQGCVLAEVGPVRPINGGNMATMSQRLQTIKLSYLLGNLLYLLCLLNLLSLHTIKPIKPIIRIHDPLTAFYSTSYEGYDMIIDTFTIPSPFTLKSSRDSSYRAIELSRLKPWRYGAMISHHHARPRGDYF